MLDDMPRTRHMLARIFPRLFGLRRSNVLPPRRKSRDGVARRGLDVLQASPEQRDGGLSPSKARERAHSPE